VEVFSVPSKNQKISNSAHRFKVRIGHFEASGHGFGVLAAAIIVIAFVALPLVAGLILRH
jgi:hypothetical protein